MPVSDAGNSRRVFLRNTAGLLGATALPKVLGAADPRVETLRRFRDTFLARSATGRRLINFYYTNAEAVDATLDTHCALKAVSSYVLKVFVPVLALFF